MDAFPIEPIDPVAAFPSLAELPQSPKKLFIRGTLASCKNKKYIAIVGSRAYTGYGALVCKTLIEGLRGYPVVIVSGLALGIDAIAHQTALDCGITTIGFPGSGLSTSVLYPACHKELARTILERGGALISEYDSMARAAYWTFPQRNRLVAGVADMVIVIEAKEKSGALITARLGTEYNKIVGAVPGSIFSEPSKGTNWLLTLGAVPIRGPEDVIRELGLAAKDPLVSDVIVNDTEAKVLAFLDEPKTREAVIQALQLSPTEAAVVFSTLEIKGLVTEVFGLLQKH